MLLKTMAQCFDVVQGGNMLLGGVSGKLERLDAGAPRRRALGNAPNISAVQVVLVQQ